MNDNRHLSWKVELRKIIDANKGQHATRDKTVSTYTKQHRVDVLYRNFQELRDLGYKLDNPANFREKHFIALLQHWIERDLSSSSIQNMTSVLHTFCKWIGRPNMIKTLSLYVTEKDKVKRTQVADVDKSWTGNNVSFEEVLMQIDQYDVRAGAQMRIIHAFGLRREEAVCFQPRMAMKLGEERNAIYVSRGTKNGLKRFVDIETDEQIEALEYACNIVKHLEESLGWENLTLKQAVKRMANIMQKFKITKKDSGVTLHGLRHESLHTVYELVTGIPVPVKGGDTDSITPELDLLGRHKMTMAAGHARLSITNAYAGSHKVASEKKIENPKKRESLLKQKII